MSDQTTPVNLGLPADPASVSVLRTVVASVAARLDLPYDAVDDLRIAAAEASTLLLTAAPASESARLNADLAASPAELTLTIWVSGVQDDEDAHDESSLAWRVIEGLADRAARTSVDGCRAIELRMRTLGGRG